MTDSEQTSPRRPETWANCTEYAPGYKVAIVYLAGGMKSDWQDKVIAACPEFAFRDPRTHGLKTEKEYTKWDLAGIMDSHTVFAYMDSTNPSGFGLSLEVGYARALQRDIIYVCEDTTDRQKYFGMVRACATQVHTSLDDGIAAMKALWA